MAEKKVSIPLTAEEKQATKAQKKLKNKLLTEEKKQNTFKNHMKREMELTKKSRIILDKHWDTLCGNILKKDLILTMSCIHQNLLRTLDVKDTIIEKLLDDIEKANNQYKRRLDGHIHVLAYLMSKMLIVYLQYFLGHFQFQIKNPLCGCACRPSICLSRFTFLTLGASQKPQIFAK